MTEPKVEAFDIAPLPTPKISTSAVKYGPTIPVSQELLDEAEAMRDLLNRVDGWPDDEEPTPWRDVRDCAIDLWWALHRALRLDVINTWSFGRLFR